VLCHSIKFFIDKNTCRKQIISIGIWKKNLTVTLKKGRKKATIKKANYFYWYLEKKLNRDAQKGGNKKENT